MRRAVLAGGSGFIGRRLGADLERRGYTVGQIGRGGPDARWGEPDRIRALLDGADLLVNLAGKSVGCRYTERNRDEIYRSRVETTAELRAAMAAADDPPAVWLNASTATIYRHATDRPQTEADGDVGAGFSVDVARDWERELFADELPGTRRVALRMAIVLGDGPAVQMLARAARFGLGGPQIDGWWLPHDRYRGIGRAATDYVPHDHAPAGEQKFSWIHLDDLLAAIAFLVDSDIAGGVNLASPGTSDNAGLMRSLRRAVGVPFGLPAYRWMLEPGMFVLRQESELVLKSRWVMPAVLQQAGFRFTWTDLDAAVTDVVRR